MSNQEKKHHHLFALQIIFSVAEGPAGSVAINQLLTTDSSVITLKDIGRTQQSAQIAFAKKMEDAGKYEVLDVVIMGISYLGHMAESEFHNLKVSNDGK